MLDEKSKHYLQVISEAAQQMGRLIDDCSRFSRMGRIRNDAGSASIWFACQRSCHPGTTGITSQRDIVWRVGTLPEVRGDQRCSWIVFEKLVANAVKFTRLNPQSEIEIGHDADH